MKVEVRHHRYDNRGAIGTNRDRGGANAAGMTIDVIHRFAPSGGRLLQVLLHIY